MWNIGNNAMLLLKLQRYYHLFIDDSNNQFGTGFAKIYPSADVTLHFKLNKTPTIFTAKYINTYFCFNLLF